MPKYNSVTTLNEIRACGPCREGWKKLLGHLGKAHADDEPLPLLTVLESNGIDDALRCLRAPSLDRLSRHFQAWCADQVLHIFEGANPSDTRVRDQITMLRKDDASAKERAAARYAALVAVSGALEATREAAWVGARPSAWGAARSAAIASARGATRNAEWDAARADQEAQLRAMIAE